MSQIILAHYQVSPIEVGQLEFQFGNVTFQESAVHIVVQDDHNNASTPLIIAYEALKSFRIIASMNSMELGMNERDVRDWLVQNQLDEDEADEDPSDLERTETVRLSFQPGVLGQFRESIAPIIAESRRARSSSRWSCTSLLPLPHTVVALASQCPPPPPMHQEGGVTEAVTGRLSQNHEVVVGAADLPNSNNNNSGMPANAEVPPQEDDEHDSASSVAERETSAVVMISSQSCSIPEEMNRISDTEETTSRVNDHNNRKPRNSDGGQRKSVAFADAEDLEEEDAVRLLPRGSRKSTSSFASLAIMSTPQGKQTDPVTPQLLSTASVVMGAAKAGAPTKRPREEGEGGELQRESVGMVRRREEEEEFVYTPHPSKKKGKPSAAKSTPQVVPSRSSLAILAVVANKSGQKDSAAAAVTASASKHTMSSPNHNSASKSLSEAVLLPQALRFGDEAQASASAVKRCRFESPAAAEKVDDEDEDDDVPLYALLQPTGKPNLDRTTDTTKAGQVGACMVTPARNPAPTQQRKPDVVNEANNDEPYDFSDVTTTPFQPTKPDPTTAMNSSNKKPTGGRASPPASSAKKSRNASKQISSSSVPMGRVSEKCNSSRKSIGRKSTELKEHTSASVAPSNVGEKEETACNVDTKINHKERAPQPVLPLVSNKKELCLSEQQRAAFDGVPYDGQAAAVKDNHTVVTECTPPATTGKASVASEKMQLRKRTLFAARDVNQQQDESTATVQFPCVSTPWQVRMRTPTLQTPLRGASEHPNRDDVSRRAISVAAGDPEAQDVSAILHQGVTDENIDDFLKSVTKIAKRCKEAKRRRQMEERGMQQVQLDDCVTSLEELLTTQSSAMSTRHHDVFDFFQRALGSLISQAQELSSALRTVEEQWDNASQAESAAMMATIRDKFHKAAAQCTTNVS